AFFIAPLLLSPPGDFAKAIFNIGNLASLILRNGLLAGLFYANLLYLCPSVWRNKGTKIYLLIIVAVVVAVGIVNWQIHHVLSEPHGPPPPWAERHHEGAPNHRPMMFASPLFSSLLISSIVVVLSSSLFLWQNWNDAEALAREQELERRNAELAALKLQISPHFLFNTLNNIRWLIRSQSPSAEESVVQLSQLLRYILYQTSTEKVELTKEVEHLIGYVELQTMRLTKANTFEINITGDAGNKMIVPLLLLPIAENLFKHGDFNGDYINRINIAIEENRLVITSINRAIAADEAKDNLHGIGLTNLKKRLEMYYPHQHILQTSYADKTYTLQLEIILN
ncbi:MAG: sensor histidine kinase, partial [Flammeovirgaceae bacterium]